MPDFAFARAEFDGQARVLEALVGAIGVASKQEMSTSVGITGSKTPILPPTSENTMAAAAVVLLAAHFEEYVRQQIEEYAKAVVNEYSHLDISTKEKIVEFYWKAGSSKLARIRPSWSRSWSSEAETILRALIEYPLAIIFFSLILNSCANTRTICDGTPLRN